jgi:hypothetical protein
MPSFIHAALIDLN